MAGAGVTLLWLALLVGAVGAWHGLDTPVTSVRVLGTLNEAEQVQVREVVARQARGGILSTDLEALQASLEALSWPRRISVRRVWPDKLLLALDKALVVASWNGAYLTMDGEIVELATPVPGLVAFDCAHTEPLAALDLYQRLSRELSASTLELVGLEENQLGEWSLTFTDGLMVKLGREQHRARLRRFLAVYDAELAGRARQVASVDARYANGIAVRWLAPAGDSAAQLAGVPSASARGPITRAEHGFR